jgi:hypothetical protein
VKVVLVLVVLVWSIYSLKFDWLWFGCLIVKFSLITKPKNNQNQNNRTLTNQTGNNQNQRQPINQQTDNNKQ